MHRERATPCLAGCICDAAQPPDPLTMGAIRLLLEEQNQLMTSYHVRLRSRQPHAAAAVLGSLMGRWKCMYPCIEYPCPPPWAYVCPDDVHRRAGAPGALLRPQPQLPVARVHTASAREWHCALQWLTQIRRPRWQLAAVTARHLLKDRCSALIEQPCT